MGVFQSKSYDVKGEEDKKGLKDSIKRKKADHQRVQLPDRMSNEIKAARISDNDIVTSGVTKESKYVTISEDANIEHESIETHKLHEEEAPNSKPTVEVAVPTSDFARCINMPTAKTANVPEKQQGEVEKPSQENIDAILVVNEEAKVASKPVEPHESKEEQAKRERNRSICIENEIFQAVAHIPEKRDSKLIAPLDEEIAKEKERLLAEIEKVEAQTSEKALEASVEESHKKEKERLLADLEKVEPRSSENALNTEKIDNEYNPKKEQESIEITVKSTNLEKQDALKEDKLDGVSSLMKEDTTEEKVGQESELETPVQIHKEETKEDAVEKPVLKDTTKAQIELEEKASNEETVVNNVCNLQTIEIEETVISTTNKEDIKIEVVTTDVDTNKHVEQAPAKEKAPVEVSRKEEIIKDKTPEDSTAIKLNEEQNVVEVENQQTNLVSKVQETSEPEAKPIESTAKVLVQEEKSVSDDRNGENQAKLNQSKDISEENKAKKQPEPEVILTESERDSIIEEMCSRVNQMDKEELEHRRVSLIMSEVPVLKPQLKEQPENHINETDEQKASLEGVPENLRQIRSIEDEVRSMTAQIIHFGGTTKDTEYLTLHETLIRNIIKLDDISVENNDEIREERKRVIKFAQQCLNNLEGKVETSKSDGSDSE